MAGLMSVTDDRGSRKPWLGAALPSTDVVRRVVALPTLISRPVLGRLVGAGLRPRAPGLLTRELSDGASTIGRMSDDASESNQEQQPGGVAGATEDGRVYVVTPQAMAVEGPPTPQDEAPATATSITDQVSEPAKVMRIATMIRQLLDEVKSAPLDEASRQRMRSIYTTSVEELKQGLAPDLVTELEQLSLPFSSEATPSDAELRIAQAQLVGWLEGLFHGIQTALFAQQMAARAQLEQLRRALPAGASPPIPGAHPTGGTYL